MFLKQSAESLEQENTPTSAERWNVLLVDDEPDVHTITEMALRNIEFEGQKLNFLNAYSGAEAREIMAEHSDIAVVFLDVVMETDDAGLLFAKWVREELGNQLVRIILRTGQPGQAPEEKVIVEYDINDYKEKTELVKSKLFTTTLSALRGYRDLLRVEDARKFQERSRIGLETVIQSSTKVFEKRSLREFIQGLLSQLSSLLHIDQDTLLIQTPTLAALEDIEQGSLEVLAGTGTLKDCRDVPLHVMKLMQKAIDEKHSLLENNCFVGYFGYSKKKISLLYIEGVEDLDDIDHKLIEIFSTNVTIAFENLMLNSEIQDTQTELINLLSDVVENRSMEAANHVKRMAEVCYILAEKYGMPAEDCELLRRAAPMHDIGKIGIADKILLKPGKLDTEEFEIMKQHAEIGYRILERSKRPILRTAADIAYEHHEKFDGTGYPRQLKGEEISIWARIVAVADVFDALTHARCYKDPWPIEKVVEYFLDHKGRHFDPKVVDLLLKNLDDVTLVNHRYPDS